MTLPKGAGIFMKYGLCPVALIWTQIAGALEIRLNEGMRKPSPAP